MRYIKRFYIEKESDVLNLTLNDVLSVVPVKYKMYDFVGTTQYFKSVPINLKMNQIISDFESHIVWVNDDVSLKFLLAEHLRNVLYILFQSNEDDKTVLDDYSW